MDLFANRTDFVECEQQRHKPACASKHIDQRLWYYLRLKCIMAKLLSSKIPIFWLGTVAEQAELSLIMP